MQQAATYDYIICGGGMAGLSLVWHLNQQPELGNKKILIIEPEKKNQNDRTWAFWEKGNGYFEEIVYRKWEKFRFTSRDNQASVFPFGGYTYKVIRGIDFYRLIDKIISDSPNIDRLADKVIQISDVADGVHVKTASGKEFHGKWAFDSFTRPSLDNPAYNNLWQHFLGYIIETEYSAFDPTLPDLMNFSVEQVNDECRFIYILPFEKNKALIEYTVFSDNLLQKADYKPPLESYINELLQGNRYTITEEEYGIIPMSDAPFEQHPGGRVLRIGTAGGYTHAATGYTFLKTQERLSTLAEVLAKNGNAEDFLKKTRPAARHTFYPSVLLGVLLKKRHPAADVFRRFYGDKKVEQAFKFLDGKTNLFEEIQIFARMPINPFLRSAIAELKKKLRLA